METKESIFIRINTDIELPKDPGNYLATLEYPNGTLVIKKVFFLKEFKLNNGRKKCKVINWFKRIEIDDELYQKILEKDIY